MLQVTGNQGKQIRRFHKWILPGNPVPPAIFTPINVVAVRQQHGVAFLVRDDGRGVLGHHIWTVKVPGDIPKTFCLTLRTKHLTRLVQSFKRCVVLRLYLHRRR